MKKLQAVLRSLQIFDATNKLSLTSLALMVIIYKLAEAPTLDWTILTGFFLALLQYSGKKLINAKESAKAISDQDKLLSVESTIASLQEKIPSQESIQKLEDTVRTIKNSIALR